MMPPTTTPSVGEARRHEQGHGYGLVLFASILLLAAAGVLAGNQLARTAAVVVLGFNAIDQMFFIPAYPFWALTIIAMDVVALWGLCAYGSRANLQAA